MRMICIILLINSIWTIAQQNSNLLFKGETVFHLINFNNSLVNLQAERILNQGGKWYPNSLDSAGKLIKNNEFDSVIINNINNNDAYSQFVSYVYIDLEGDDDYEHIIARSFYKIKFIGKDSYLYFNTASLVFKDTILTYDYINDKFYYGECSTCSNEIINGSIIRTFNNYITDELEDYWYNALFLIPNETESYPRLIWRPIPDFNATSYKIYRAIANSAGLSIGNYSLISTTLTDVFEYVDEEIDLGDNQYVFYYVAAYNSSTNQNSKLTNLVYTKEIANKWKASLLLETTIGINPHLYW